MIIHTVKILGISCSLKPLVNGPEEIIDTFHKEGKSQRVITERGGCSWSAVSKHIKCRVYWKEEIG